MLSSTMDQEGARGKWVWSLNFFKDTLVYLKLVGNPDFSNSIRFNKNNEQIHDLNRTVVAWDTIPMELNY